MSGNVKPVDLHIGWWQGRSWPGAMYWRCSLSTWSLIFWVLQYENVRPRKDFNSLPMQMMHWVGLQTKGKSSVFVFGGSFASSFQSNMLRSRCGLSFRSHKAERASMALIRLVSLFLVHQMVRRITHYLGHKTPFLDVIFEGKSGSFVVCAEWCEAVTAELLPRDSSDTLVIMRRK
jgi:hypothetical protein